LTLVTLPPVEGWCGWFDELVLAGRASAIERGGKALWIATERIPSANDVVLTLRGWMESIGPATVQSLALRLAFTEQDVEIGMAKLESEGQVLSGRFSGGGTGNLEWCNRRILARIHRATLGRLRREIEPVTQSQFHEFLFRWQHVSTGTQLHGADGLLEIIRQMQGYEIPASAWESQIFPSRIAKYEPELLDELCLSGEVMWARVSPHPALEDAERKVRATRIAPMSFFLREDAEWLLAGPEVAELGSLSQAAREVVEVLSRQGASFFHDLTRATKRPGGEVEDALWELTAAGLVTADGFENLRSLIDPKRRRGEARPARRRHAAGRWALIQREVPQPNAEKFARQLLARWGVVVRDLLARETVSPPWRDLLVVLRRMEAQGEIRGGRFVGGLTGEQFARPEALDLLRAIRRAGVEGPRERQIPPADPLNLAGIILPGPRVSQLMAAVG
jgi:ATP-dependent Lhr-like helicase